MVCPVSRNHSYTYIPTHYLGLGRVIDSSVYGPCHPTLSSTIGAVLSASIACGCFCFPPVFWNDVLYFSSCQFFDAEIKLGKHGDHSCAISGKLFVPCIGGHD